MKKTFFLFVIFTLIFQSGLSTIHTSAFQESQAPAQAEGESSSMPGWPMPDKPIPHHEPGRVSKASSYTTQVKRVNEEGLLEAVQIDGLDAIVADGGEPFAGNYTLVENDQLLRSAFANNTIDMETMTISGTITEIPGSQRYFGNYPANDITAGDLNGDGVDEQIAAWMGGQNHIIMATGEMSGRPGKTTSVPAAVANSGALLDGYTLNLDGVDDYVNVGSGINLANSSFTIAFWAKRLSVSTSDVIVGQGNGSANMGLHIGFRPNDTFTCAFWNNDLNTTVYTDNDWHHWACTYDAGTNLRSIYRDGALVTQDTAPADYQGSGEMYLGHFNLSIDDFGGLIDEVGIWNAARTPDLIQVDPFRNVPDGTNLVAYWHFDEGSGTTAVDSSGNGHDGTLVNAPLWDPEDSPQEDLHLLARGYDESLWHCFYDVETGRCLSWNNAAGGTWLSAPTVASLGTDQFDAFVIGTDNQVYGRHWALGWSGSWQQYGVWPFPAPAWTVPLPELPAPAAVARGGGIDLFRLSPDTDTLYWYDGVSWQDLGGIVTSPPAAVSLPADHMQVFALGMDGAIWYRTFTSGWGEWQWLPLDGMPAGTTIVSAPAAVSLGAGQIALYVRGSDNRVWSIFYDGNDWGSWTAGGGELASAPAASVVSGVTYLFAQKTDRLLQTSQDGLNWQDLGGLNPCCMLQDTGNLPTRKNSGEFQDYTLDIETGYFWGDGRSQTVLAYFSNSNQVEVVLHDISDEFDKLAFTHEPAAQMTIPHTVDRFRITTGDFLDHDGQDDIAFAYLAGNTAGVDILRFSADPPELSVVTSHTYPVDWTQISLDIAGGDFDADGQDEIAVTTITSFDDSECIWPFTIYTWHYLPRMRVYDVDKVGSAYEMKAYYVETQDNRRVQQIGNRENLGLALAAGDVNGDGKDEILRTWIDHFDSWSHQPCTDSIDVADRVFRKVQVIDLPTNANPDQNTWPGDLPDTVIKYSTDDQGYTQRSYGDRLASGDFDRDGVDEFVWQVANNTPAQDLYAFKFNPQTQGYDNIATKPKAWGNYPDLVTGDFTGESIRVGPPTYRMQVGMTTPEVFLNLPPMHRDIISGVGEVVIDNGATAVYSAGNTEENKSTSESKRDWSISVGLETSAGAAGSKVTASLDDTYGQNFSSSETAINSWNYTDQTTAQYFDQVIYNGTNYGVWEYPVTGVETGDPDQPATISVVFPLVDTTTQPATAQGRTCDENFYTPSHQPYNVWSYDRIGSVLFKDYDPNRLVESKQTSGGSDFSIGMSSATESLRTDSFNNQINAGLEYSYENELEVPLIGKAWDFSFRASVKGQYGLEEISTLGSTFTENTAVQVNFPSSPDPSAYQIIAYFYWAKAGYLVVDYQSEPSLDGSWLLYNKTDPAFILPWYGFPDPATGEFPAPPDMDAPPCGADKQLFTHDIQIEPAYAQNGDTVNLRATVRNFSNNTPPSDVLVRFYLGYPAAGNQIASCSIPRLQLARSHGSAVCSTSWPVEGVSGVEKIFAVIDPSHAFNEMHDEDDMINNNVGYGLLYAANADYVDPGLRQSQAYQSISYEEAPGSRYALFVPTTNITETVRYELVPIDLGRLSIVGVPIQVLAFRGGEQLPDDGLTFSPTPAGFEVIYNNSDLLPGMRESNLKLYRLSGTSWVEATCPGYQFYRFPDENAIATPICQTGTYILSTDPMLTHLFLPVLTR